MTWRGFKGRVMDPLFVLVCPCFRENVVVTCKIVSSSCSLDNLLKNVNVFFFGNQILKWRSFGKGWFLIYFSQFLDTREKLQNFLQHNLTYIHTHILLTLLIFFFFFFFLPYQFCENYEVIMYVSLWCDSWCWFYLRHFWASNE